MINYVHTTRIAYMRINIESAAHIHWVCWVRMSYYSLPILSMLHTGLAAHISPLLERRMNTPSKIYPRLSPSLGNQNGLSVDYVLRKRPSMHSHLWMWIWLRQMVRLPIILNVWRLPIENYSWVLLFWMGTNNLWGDGGLLTDIWSLFTFTWRMILPSVL